MLFRPTGVATLRKLLDTGLLSDFTVVDTQGQRHQLHRAVLALHCGYFARGFANATWEETSRVTLPWSDPLHLMPELIGYMYSHELEVNVDRWAGLFAGATQLQMAELQQMLMQFLDDHVRDARNALVLLQTTLQYPETLEVPDGHPDIVGMSLRVVQAHFLELCRENADVLSTLPLSTILTLLSSSDVSQATKDSLHVTNMVIEYIVTGHPITEETFRELLLYVHGIPPFRALQMLEKAVHFRVQECVDVCLAILRAHFEELAESGYLPYATLPAPVFAQLIQADDLMVTTEDTVLDEVLRYIASGSRERDPRDIKALLSIVRYSFLSPGHCAKAYNNPLVKQHVSDKLLEGMLRQLMARETPKTPPPPKESEVSYVNESQVNSNKPRAHTDDVKLERHELRYEAPLDKNGVFYWIGTQGNKTAFENPSTTNGGVLVTTSGSAHQPTELTGRDGQVAQTSSQNAEDNVWFAIDLGPGRNLMPNRYTLRGRTDTDSNFPRYWKFEASRDGDRWLTLRTHENDETLVDRGQVADWVVDAQEAFRHFRILQYGPASDDSNYLTLSGVELYGKLIDKLTI